MTSDPELLKRWQKIAEQNNLTQLSSSLRLDNIELQSSNNTVRKEIKYTRKIPVNTVTKLRTNIIFAILSENKLYIGGDRSEPELVYTLEEGYIFESNGITTIYLDEFGNEISPSSPNYPPRTTTNLENATNYAFQSNGTVINIKKTGINLDDYIISFIIFDTLNSTNSVYKYGLRVISGGQLISKDIEIPQIETSSIDPNLIVDAFFEEIAKDRYQTNFIFNGLGNFFFQEGYFICCDLKPVEVVVIGRNVSGIITSRQRTIETKYRTFSINILEDEDTLDNNFKVLSLTKLATDLAIPPIEDIIETKVSPFLTLNAIISSAVPFDGVDAYFENVIPASIDTNSNTALTYRSNGLPTIFVSSTIGNIPNPDFTTNLFFYAGNSDGVEIIDSIYLYPNLINNELTSIVELPPTIDEDEEGVIETKLLKLDGNSEAIDEEVDYIGITEGNNIKSVSVFF